MIPHDEIVTIVDIDNNVTGSEYRSKMRISRLIHRATFIFVTNSDNNIFVQKRSKTKDLYPGFYDITTGGVVLADESYEESAKREVYEELGIQNVPMQSLFDFYYSSVMNNVWGRVFECSFDGHIILQKEEIESGQFYHVEEIETLIKKEPVTPESVYVFNRWRSKSF